MRRIHLGLRRTVGAGCLALLVAGPAAAKDLHASYLQPDAVPLSRVLPPPPAAGSARDRDDMAAVRAATAARDPADARRITDDLPCTLDRFADVLGPDFTAARMPVTAALIERVFQDGELAVLAAKARIARPRPYVRDPALATFGHRSDSTSYPSGHATFGALAATVLAALVPDKAEALFARATAYGRNRLIAGTHFPSDLEAGRIAAAVIAAALLRDPTFEADLSAARDEVRRVAGRD